MTAADQPTTEPSAVERAAAALYFEDCGVAPDDMVRRSEEYDTSFRAPAQVLADAGLLNPAPQPAADTETEVQWGVRDADGKAWPIEKPDPHTLDRLARAGAVVVRRTAAVTPWEEA